MATTPFLARLQLDTDADARAIRRAYARELKLIDQAADPAGFQHLRECYERALAWAERVARAREASTAPAPEFVAATQAEPVEAVAESAPQPSSTAAPEPATPEPAAPQPAPAWRAPDPAALAQSVFTELCEALPELVDLPAPSASESAVGLLRGMLADPRLEHLEAHERFEALVAHLLAAGWRPGHESLLPAAVQVFGWDADRRTLRRLQRDGLMLDAALDQQAAFEAQSAPAGTRQREVLAMLRKATPPTEQTMSNLIVPLRTMAGRYPHWLGLVAPAGAVRHWLERCAQFEAPQAAAGTVAGTPKLGMRKSTPGAIGAVILVMLGLNVVRHLTDSSTYSPRQPNPDTVRIMERARRQPPPLRHDQQLSPELDEAIRARIHYRPTPGTPSGLQDTRLEVYLDDQGNMVGVKWLKRSSDPAFSDAVEKALHDSGPYPSYMERVFAVGYKVQVSFEKRLLRPMRKPAPWEPLRPGESMTVKAPPSRPWTLRQELPGTGRAEPGSSPAPAPTPTPPEGEQPGPQSNPN